MSEVGKWLQGIGLGQYADGFDTNEIDMELLRQVDDQLLRTSAFRCGWCRVRGSNPRPSVYKTAALPLS